VKKIYVIGHRNPDTDSVVSAAAYAALKQAQGVTTCVAARAGHLNPQTEYIFNRFKAPVPVYLPDLVPKAAYYLRDHCPTINESASLWEALEFMEKENLRILPVVDDLGVYKSMLHYRGFARYVISHINPNQKAVFPVSIDYLLQTLSAQPIVVTRSTEVKDSPILVAASSDQYFIRHIERINAENALVIMGDRFDLQRYCVEHRVRALILSNGHTLSAELAGLAEANGVSVLSSPYDTTSTAMLIIYSIPVGAMGDASVPLMRQNDPVRRLREPLTKAPGRSLPVADDEGRVVGVFQEGDLFAEPNIEIIMVDHNEPSQAIEGVEHYRLLEVIDHHRVGNISTRYPITFINKPVGATATIVTNLYREQRVPMRREIAAILLCGILSDTLFLKSATTTPTDQEAAAYLSRVTGLALAELSREIQDALNQLGGKSAAELVALDRKEYAEGGVTFAVSQIETVTLDAMVQRREEFIAVLDEARQEAGQLFASLLITDITALDSILLVGGDKALVSAFTFPRLDDGAFVLKGVVSRKKQLVPMLSELCDALRKAGKL